MESLTIASKAANDWPDDVAATINARGDRASVGQSQCPPPPRPRRSTIAAPH